LGGSSTNWTRLAAVLAATNPGYIVDLPGSGRSDPPPRGRYSVTEDADLVAALIRRVSGGPVHLLGNSMGGVVATALAARHRDLVSSLTLISPAVPDLRLGRDRGADARLAVVMVPGITSAAERRLAAVDAMARARGMAVVCFGDPAGVTEEDLEVAAADLAWRSGLPWALRSTIFSLRALIRSYLRPGRWSFAAAARAVRVPTLVMWGTRDKLVDVRLAQPTSALFPDGRLLVIAGSGHVAQMEHPGPTAAAVAALWEDADAAPRIGRHPAAPTPGAPQPNRDPAVATSTA
jgi:pimeloyl-ACP methyl ester carboxylesterase